MRDWAAWHSEYDDPDSSLATRLALVQSHLANALTSAPAGPLRLLSLCAGEGRDVFGVLPGHARRSEVRAVLVESDPRNADAARRRANEAGLADAVEVREADASQVTGFADVLPADVLLLCGIFGNVSDEDIHRTATAAAMMCRSGGTVIWTRHRRDPDLTPHVRTWFAQAGFEEVAFETPSTATLSSVGVQRLRSAAADARLADGPLFTFRQA